MIAGEAGEGRAEWNVGENDLPLPPGEGIVKGAGGQRADIDAAGAGRQLVAGAQQYRGTRPAGRVSGPHLDGALDDCHFERGGGFGAHVELRSRDAHGTGGRFDDERTGGLLVHGKERFTGGEAHVASVPVDLDLEAGLGVEFDPRPVGKGECLAHGHG